MEPVKCTVIPGRTLVGPADRYNFYDRTIKFFQVMSNYGLIRIFTRAIFAIVLTNGHYSCVNYGNVKVTII